MTPGGQGMGDVLGISDADWNRVLEDLGDWEPQRSVEQAGNMLETMATATRR